MTTLDKQIAIEEQIMIGKVHKSKELHNRAVKSVPGGVPSSWASSRPVPIWIDRGDGAYLWDVDGNQFIDFHAGYGANIAGHGNPAIVRAVQQRVTQGTHFAQPSADII